MQQYLTITSLLFTCNIIEKITNFLFPQICRIFSELFFEATREVTWGAKTNLVCYLGDRLCGGS